jgi:hypothetical protein
MQINGMKVIVSPYMGQLVTDWSGCRSPARAMRRAKRGFPQRSKAVYRPKGQFMVDEAAGVIYCHPEDYKRLREAVPLSMYEAGPPEWQEGFLKKGPIG